MLFRKEKKRHSEAHHFIQASRPPALMGPEGDIGYGYFDLSDMSGAKARFWFKESLLLPGKVTLGNNQC